MSRIFSNRSIIQTTLFNITLCVFVVVMILIVLFGQTFWEKESLKLDYELLETALEVKEDLENHLQIMTTAISYEDTQTAREQQVYKLSKEIPPILLKYNTYSVAYYDLGAKYLISEEDEKKINAEDVLAILDITRSNQLKMVNRVRLVSVPVIHGETLKGYVWAYATSPQVTFKSYKELNVFFILMLGFLALTILLIHKHMKEIQHQLEKFSESIVHPETNLAWNFHGLPELEPAFHKIIGYTQELNAINEELGASQQRFTQIMEGISDGLFSIDREWRLLFYNDVAKKYFDKPDAELKMKNMLDIFPSFSNTITYQYIAEVFITAEPAYFEADGMMTSERIFHTSIYPFEEGITVFFRDITEQRQQQHEMARLERLNLVGQMAAGISHEIRNPLTTVKGFLQLRGIKVTDPDEKEYNDLMISEIDRANTIISEFLSLAKDNMGSTQEQDINQIIYRIFPMIQADANNGNKDLILNLNPLPSLWLNENEIRQLLLNFVRNALEVTPQGGCVIIRTYDDKNNVVLAVQDQGCGIPEEIRDKIGTPFFTTKESGTGLGIAISMGIAHRHNAELTFDTGDQGTTFKVIFKRRNILGKNESELS